MIHVQHRNIHDICQWIFFYHIIKLENVFQFLAFCFGFGYFLGGSGYMIPGCDTEYDVGVGDFFGVYYHASFAFDAICAIPAGFCYSALIDFVQAGQDQIKLMIQCSILVPTVSVLAKVYFFEYVPVVEVVYSGC
jgi:hypothetical protein